VHCIRHGGLCYGCAKAILPQLAQPGWYRLVRSTIVEAVDETEAVGYTPDERKRRKREAVKRFRRAAKAAIAMQAKRRETRRLLRESRSNDGLTPFFCADGCGEPVASVRSRCGPCRERKRLAVA